MQRDDGMRQILNCLGNIAEWPDPENGFRRNSAADSALRALPNNIPSICYRSGIMINYPTRFLACARAAGKYVSLSLFY